ncbi:sodium:solute symporter family protein [Methanonatronarchaeum sp. AMET-Sl]|uniref:sodium:solute symporter family protein n=1 Tax=Methanonatronarchaeum sp. AMET-Sl TaxID=3037654 RepID=UPI00244DA23B|nr:sodium:solute symporter family protein [Methanonatronarchaeum sp. AMET-Sl]WGI17698.1 sodium:solute symporter family protein [Methanonatronarchaeum sp. AMET-Sl]
MEPFYLYLAMAVWLAIIIGVSEYSRHHLGSGVAEFVLAGRDLGGFVSAMTYSATTFSSFMMVGLVGLTYSTGVGAVGFEMTYIIFTILLLIIFAPKFWSASQVFGTITPPELLSERYSYRTGVVSAIICLVMLIPYMSIQMMGVGFLLEGMTSGAIPYMHGVYIVALLSIAVTIWAGMRSVALTDAIQAIIMLLSALILLFYIFYVFFGSTTGFINTITTENPELLGITWDIHMFVGMTLPWAFFALTNPQVSQRMYVSRDITSLKKMIIYFAIFGLIYTIISTLLGLSAATLRPGLPDPDNAMPTLLTMVPEPLALLVFLGIFAASVSTLGSVLLTLSSIGSRDLIKPTKKLNNKKEILSNKGLILLLVGACIIFSSQRLDLIAALASAASAGLLVMAPTIIGGFYWKKPNSTAATTSMAIPAIIVITLYTTGIQPLNWWPAVWGLITSTTLYITITLITKPSKNGKKFINKINNETKKQGFKPQKQTQKQNQK